MTSAGRPSKTQPYLVFDLGRGGVEPLGTFALSVDSILQVIEPLSLVRVPLAAKVVVGILNNHGRVVTVVDPALLLGHPAQGTPVSQVVVLRSSLRGSPNLGLQVCRSHGIVPVAELTVADVPLGPCVAWVAQRAKRLIHILELEPLLLRLREEFGPVDKREGLQGVTV